MVYFKDWHSLLDFGVLSKNIPYFCFSGSNSFNYVTWSNYAPACESF